MPPPQRGWRPMHLRRLRRRHLLRYHPRRAGLHRGPDAWRAMPTRMVRARHLLRREEVGTGVRAREGARRAVCCGRRMSVRCMRRWPVRCTLRRSRHLRVRAATAASTIALASSNGADRFPCPCAFRPRTGSRGSRARSPVQGACTVPICLRPLVTICPASAARD